MLDLTQHRIIVTGGNGFLGRHVYNALRSRGCLDIFCPHSEEYDLRNQPDTYRLFRDFQPSVVLHLAAKCGGIGANLRSPADFIHDNLAMGLSVIDTAKRFEIRKLLLVGTVCSYPADNPGDICETDLWDGYPEKTNAPYGIAKRTLGEMLQAYHTQYGLPSAYVIPANLYGPGDNFDPLSSHVIPAMIRRFCDAREACLDYVTCWGTGQPTRDFLYVTDAAEAIVRAVEHVECPCPINVGTGSSVSMSDLAERIAAAVGFTGKIEWDSSQPDGQMRRQLDTTRQREILGWEAEVGLDEGIPRVVEWYRTQQVCEQVMERI